MGGRGAVPALLSTPDAGWAQVAVRLKVPRSGVASVRSGLEPGYAIADVPRHGA